MKLRMGDRKIVVNYLFFTFNWQFDFPLTVVISSLWITNRIINWRIWLNCSRVSSLTRTLVIKSKHKFFSGKKIWSVYIANNSVCAATWHLYRVANCQIPRYVEFIFLFRVFAPPYIYGVIVLYNNSSTAFTLKLDILFLFLFPFPFLLRFIYLPFFYLGCRVANVCERRWENRNCDFFKRLEFKSLRFQYSLWCSNISINSIWNETKKIIVHWKTWTVDSWFLNIIICVVDFHSVFHLLLSVKIGYFHWRKHFSTHAHDTNAMKMIEMDGQECG